MNSQNDKFKPPNINQLFKLDSPLLQYKQYKHANTQNDKKDIFQVNSSFQLSFDQENYHHDKLKHLKDSGDSLLDALIKIQTTDLLNYVHEQHEHEHDRQQDSHEHINPQLNSCSTLLTPISKKRTNPSGSKNSLQTKPSLTSESTSETELLYNHTNKKSKNSDNSKSLKNKSSTVSEQGTWRQRKQKNQHIYSKNYRQKKKEQFKVLQEENLFLKKKINELHTRIRQIQHELNKIKHTPKTVQNSHPNHRQNSLQEPNNHIMELNYPWLQKINIILEKEPLISEQTLHKQFATQYDNYGFAGKQKIQKLQYHMNEFLQHILKDSQKYLALTVINDQGLLGDSPDHDYPQTNYTMFQIMEYDTNKLELVKKFLKPFMKPSMQKLLQACQKLYRHFENVFTQVYRTHEYLKKSKDKDFLSIKQRLEMESYFQSNKYTKEMRKIRQDWMENVRDNQSEMDDYELERNNRKKLNRQHCC